MPKNNQLELSGFNYSNKFARIYLDAIETVIGEKKLNDLLVSAGMPEFSKHRPPDNLQNQFDFSYLTALHLGFEQSFGVQAGRELARQAGQTAFPAALRGFGDLAGVTTAAFQELSLDAKLDLALPAMAEVIMQFSDQISQVYPLDEKTFCYTLERCPMCWMRDADAPVCQAGQGLLEAGLHWLSGGKTFRVEIDSCVATGAEMGRFIIYREPIE